MSKTRNISDLLDANGDVKSGALDNVPASNDASALTTGTLPNARLSSVPNSALANSSINVNGTATSLGGSVTTPPAFRNLIINGDMSQAQRGTQTTGITSGGYYTVDRYRFGISNLGGWTMAQSTVVPSGQGFAKSLKLDCTTADSSPASGDECAINIRLEGQNLQSIKKGTSNAQSLTLSFWVRSAITGTFIAELDDRDNTRSCSKSYTISSADTFEKKTITFPADTTGTFDNDNARSLQLNLWLGAGTDYTSGTLATTWASRTSANRAVGQVNLASSTGQDFYITGLQLEIGTSASDFEFLPVDVNLQRCLRYFEICEGGKEFYVAGTSNQKDYVNYSVKKRASASVTAISTGENCCSSVSVDVGSRDASISGRVVGNNVFATGNNKFFEAKFSADAEL